MIRAIPFFATLSICCALAMPALAQKPHSRPLSKSALYEEIGRQVEHCVEVRLAGGSCEVKAFVVTVELPEQKEPSKDEAIAESPPEVEKTTIRIRDTSRFTSAEIKCETGFRDRAHFIGRTAIFTDVPHDECTVFFKGGAPAKTSIRGGEKKNCTFSGATTDCQTLSGEAQ